MQILTRYELAGFSVLELQGLLRRCFNELAQSQSESVERTHALASIENIQAELAQRRL